MSRDRLALLVTTSALLMSWLSTPASPRPDPAVPPARGEVAGVAPARDPAARLVQDVERESHRLGQRVTSSLPAPRPRRNPFQFGVAATTGDTAPRPVVAEARLKVPPPAVETEEVAVAPPLALKLIGLARRTDAEGTTQHQAILTSPADVYIVSTGDTLLGRFTVRMVEADAVELLELTTGHRLRLTLPH